MHVIYGFIYFIPSSEFNAYLQQIKVVFFTVKNVKYFFTSDENDLYYFTVTGPNGGYFDNSSFNFFPKRS